MAKPDRLFRVLDALRRLPQPVTAERLAAEMEVSPRTLYRDIGALRAAGARIEGEAGLGYCLTEDPALPPQMFTRLEVEALMLGLAEVGLTGDPALAKAAEAAGAKIIATLPERVQRQALHAAQAVYRCETRAPAPAHLGLIREAIWEERAVDMIYTDLSGRETQRRIYPLSVVWMDRALMLLAQCRLRQDFRRFHLKAMREVRLTEESFRPGRVSLLRAFHRILKEQPYEKDRAFGKDQPPKWR